MAAYGGVSAGRSKQGRGMPLGIRKALREARNPATAGGGAPRAASPDRSVVLGEVEELGIGMFWATDAEGNLSFLSQRALADLGTDSQSMIGKPLTQLFHDVDEEDGGKAVRIAVGTGWHVVGVGRREQQHIERKPKFEATDLHVALFKNVQQTDLDAFGKVGKFVNGENAAELLDAGQVGLWRVLGQGRESQARKDKGKQCTFHTRTVAQRKGTFAPR